METMLTILAGTGATMWLVILLLPWRPWSTRQVLDASLAPPEEELSDVTVLIPARNEAEILETTLPALTAQGRGLSIILVDDESSDGTSQVAGKAGGDNLLIIAGKPPPSGWTGKLWALEQGRNQIRTPFTLLLDADIEPRPGIIAELRRSMQEKDVQLISLMAVLRMNTFWEKLLMPTFVYFFKLLYPFHLSNLDSSRVAAAAGGCILLKTGVLNEIGGFNSVRAELIDDCALARRVKSAGYKTWMGLTHSLRSHRPYNGLGAIWRMVTRTAFTQLGYSGLALALCTVLMMATFTIPAIGLLLPAVKLKLLSAFCLLAMILSYLPTLKFYGMSPWWALFLPFVGTLYLAMTWTSAMLHWLGRGSHWKGRTYCRF